MTWFRLFVVLARAFTGTGKVAFRIEPSGAETWIGRKRPSLFGTSGASAHLNGYIDVAYVLLKAELIAASRRCGELPV